MYREAHSFLQDKEKASKLSPKAMELVMHLANEHQKQKNREDEYFKRASQNYFD